MAIEVNLNITPTDTDNKIARIDAVFNDTSALSSVSVSMASADMSTLEKRNENWDIIDDKYQTKLTKQTQIEQMVGNQEAIGKANLEARYVT